MANKTTANAFMASAQKSKREMADIQKEGSGKHETDEVELKKNQSPHPGLAPQRSAAPPRRDGGEHDQAHRPTACRGAWLRGW